MGRQDNGIVLFRRCYADNPGLRYCIAMENLRELFGCLTPAELVVVALTFDGMTCKEIGDEIGISGAAVSYRLRSARARMANACPALEDEIYQRAKGPAIEKKRCARCGRIVSANYELCKACFLEKTISIRRDIRQRILESPIDGMRQSEIACIVQSSIETSERTVERELKEMLNEGLVWRGTLDGDGHQLYYRTHQPS